MERKTLLGIKQRAEKRLILSTIVGAESFVGEKERRTTEALIYTPTTDGELFVGKMLASAAPAVPWWWAGWVLWCVGWW